MLEPHRNSKSAFLYKGLKRNGWKYHLNYMDNMLKVKCKTEEVIQLVPPVQANSLSNLAYRTELTTCWSTLHRPTAILNNHFSLPHFVNSNLGFTKDQVFISHGHTTNCTLFCSRKAHALILLSWVKGRPGNAQCPVYLQQPTPCHCIAQPGGLALCCSNR